MPRNTFEVQLHALKKQVLDLGLTVGQTIADGVGAFQTRDRVLATALVNHDEDINRARYEIEQGCYNLIATQQPLAGDLREIISILLIAIELERIADHSKNIAEIVLRTGNEPLLPSLNQLPRMAELAQQMLRQALDAFARNDSELATLVIQQDDSIDHLYKQLFQEVVLSAAQEPSVDTRELNLLFAAHNLERTADRVTNIGERVIYAATGQLEELNT